MRKCPLALSLAKSRQKDEDILKTYELFIHGNKIDYYSVLSIYGVMVGMGCTDNPKHML